MTKETGPRIRPSRLWYAMAVLLFLACAGGSTAWLLSVVFAADTGAILILGPGRETFFAERPGRYELRYLEEMLVKNHVFNRVRELPEALRFELTAANGGRSLPLSNDRRQTGGRAPRTRYRVGDFSIPEPGEYEIRISGDHEDRLFSIGPSRLRELLTAAVGCALLHLVAYIGAPAIIITVISRRTRAMNELLRN